MEGKKSGVPTTTRAQTVWIVEWEAGCALRLIGGAGEFEPTARVGW